MMRALVLGASGFAGTHLCRYLIDQGYDVTGTYRNNKIYNNNCASVYCDVRDINNVEDVLTKIKPDHIYHLAGPAYVLDSLQNPADTYYEIGMGTINILETIRRLQIFPRMLYISSAEVYGESSKLGYALEEDTPLHPSNPYAAAKAWGELACKQYSIQYGIPIIIARPFNHTGPGQSERFVCSDFTKQAVAAKLSSSDAIIKVGNIDIDRDFLDVRDVIKAYHLLIQTGVAGKIYNICSGKVVSIRQILQLIITNCELKNIQIYEEQCRVRPNDRPTVVGSNQNLLFDTNWTPAIPIEETIKDLVDYWTKILNGSGGR